MISQLMMTIIVNTIILKFMRNMEDTTNETRRDLLFIDHTYKTMRLRN